MIKSVSKTPQYTTYTYGEQEFKDLLGIGGDPSGVLLVRTSYEDRTVTVTMSPTP